MRNLETNVKRLRRQVFTEVANVAYNSENINDDIEASQANIDKLDKLFKAAVKMEVEKRLAGNAPKGNVGGSTEYTKENAKKMSIAEMNDLARNNPEQFKALFG